MAGRPSVTAALMDQALAGTVNSTFYSGKAATSAPAGSAVALLLIGSTFYRCTLDDMVFNNAALLASRTSDTSPDPNADSLLAYDASGAALRSVLTKNLLFGAGVTAWATPIGADRIPIYDSAGASSKYITLANLIHGAPAWTTPIGADELAIYDSAGGLYKRVTLNALVGGLPTWANPIGADSIPIYDSAGTTLKRATLATLITGQTAEATLADADVFLFHDASATATRKVTGANLKAYAQAGISAVTKYVSASDTSIPGADGAIEESHGLAGVPHSVQWCLVNVTGEHGYVTGDLVPVETVWTNTYPGVPFTTYKTATKVGISCATGSWPIRILHKTAGTVSTLTNSNWKLRAYATYVP